MRGKGTAEGDWGCKMGGKGVGNADGSVCGGKAVDTPPPPSLVADCIRRPRVLAGEAVLTT
eukprot:1440447-Pleurochrysis_carterae.AAC.1